MSMLAPGDLDRISRVLPYLFIGSYGAAEDAAQLEEMGITHLICLLDERPPTLASLPHLCIPMSDYGDSNLRELVAEVTPFLEDARETGGRVLLFCALGVNRSPSLAAAYLRATLNCSKEEALKQVASDRRFISPHRKYLVQLEHLEALPR